jgi:hypothetical protein
MLPADDMAGYHASPPLPARTGRDATEQSG